MEGLFLPLPDLCSECVCLCTLELVCMKENVMNIETLIIDLKNVYHRDRPRQEQRKKINRIAMHNSVFSFNGTCIAIDGIRDRGCGGEVHTKLSLHSRCCCCYWEIQFGE